MGPPRGNAPSRGFVIFYRTKIPQWMQMPEASFSITFVKGIKNLK
jgi:hypothetical protein